MPPRPTPVSRPKYNNNRISAVYIGPNPALAAAHFTSSSPLAYTSPPIDGGSIPDLPEPPSPGGSDTGSGLPSPPATNSTGSADDTQILDIPERPLSLTSSSGSSTNIGGGPFSPKDLAASGSGLSSMRRGSTGTRSLHRSSSSISSLASTSSRSGRFDEAPSRDLDVDHVHHHNGQPDHSNHEEEEGDDTARFDLRRSIAVTTGEALQRAKSLTQRNRITLDKLASIPRAGSPKSSAPTSSRSPAPPHTPLPESSTSKSSTSRLSGPRGLTSSGTTRSARSTPSTRPVPLPSSTRDPDPFPDPDLDPVYRSGSETERESTSSSYHGSNYQRPSSSASYTRPTAPASTPPPSIRRRVPSAPTSPSPLNALTAANTSRNAGGGGRGEGYEDSDVTQTSTSTGSGSASGSGTGSSSSRVRKRVSLALATPSRLGFMSVEPGRDDDDGGGGGGIGGSHAGTAAAEFGEGERRARSSLSFSTPAEERRRERVWERGREKERESVTQSALAAVASSRRGLANGGGSPYTPEGGGSGGRRRGALPAEFVRGREGDTSTDQPPSPVTPYRPSSIAFTSSNSSSASGSTAVSSHSSAAVSHASSRAGSSLGHATRTSTIRRESRHKWPSEDLTAGSSYAAVRRRNNGEGGELSHSGDGRYADPPHSADRRTYGGDPPHSADRRTYADPPHSAERRAYGEPPHSADPTRVRRTSTLAPGEPGMGMAEYRERRQSMRGGSAESALMLSPGRRSLVGEGFRAAGLSSVGRAQGGGRYSLGEGEGGGGRVFKRPGVTAGEWESEGDGEGESGFVPGGNGEGGARRVRASTLRARVGEGPRAATSMAEYRYIDAEEGGREQGVLRSTRSAYPLSPRWRDRDRERDVSLTRREALEADRSASSLSRYGALRSHVMRDQQSLDRFASPFGTGRRNHSGGSSSSVAGVATQGMQQQQQQQQQQQHQQQQQREQDHLRLSRDQDHLRLSRDQDHVRLLAESLTMFEGQMTRLGGVGELAKSAQTIVQATERLNDMLKGGATRAVEEQVNAEVDDPHGRGAEMAELWGRVGVDYRDGWRVNDDLIRGLTAFLLGISKTVRDLAAGGNGDVQHGRSVSLDEEGLGGGRRRVTMSPDVFVGAPGPGSSAGSGSGRRSVESRRSWEPRESLREDLSRRISARAESALGHARPPSSVARERERVDGRYDTSPSADALSRGSGSTGPSQPRRLFSPREQREMATPLHGNGMRTIHSQEPLEEFEPSPSPAPRIQGQKQSSDRNQPPPALTIPRPLPALPSEGFLRRNQSLKEKGVASTPPGTIRDREGDRRKASVTSIQTIRGGNNNSNFPASLTTPSSATIALTPHTVSTMFADERGAPLSPLQRTESQRSTRPEAVTFSRSSTVSVSALNGLQAKDDRRRTESNASSGAEPSTSLRAKRVMSGSETERDTRRKTVGARAGRASMDGEVSGNVTSPRFLSSTVNAADRSAALAARSIPPPMNTARRERRRTVTDIWPKDS